MTTNNFSSTYKPNRQTSTIDNLPIRHNAHALDIQQDLDIDTQLENVTPEQWRISFQISSERH